MHYQAFISKYNFSYSALMLVLVALLINPAKAQESTPISISWDGFIDIYYAFDFAKPANHIRQPFLYNHNRHNQINLNIGLIRANVEGDRIRAKLGFQAGTYAQDNYAAEEELLRNVFEANVGIALNESKNLWLDAGIFPSHLGFESALSIENLTLSRSLAAENSPYFLSGAKLTYDPSKKVTLVALVSNGWQHIARPLGNQSLAFGTQVNYHPSQNLTFNWSTFVCNDYPDHSPRMRYFNNFYATYSNESGFEFILGVDIGIEEKSNDEIGMNSWLVPTAIFRTALSERWFIATRVEHFNDPNGVIIAYDAPAAFKTTGLSINIDHEIIKNTMIRWEFRHFQSGDPIFRTGTSLMDGRFGTSSTTILSSIALKF